MSRSCWNARKHPYRGIVRGLVPHPAACDSAPPPPPARRTAGCLGEHRPASEPPEQIRAAFGGLVHWGGSKHQPGGAIGRRIHCADLVRRDLNFLAAGDLLAEHDPRDYGSGLVALIDCGHFVSQKLHRNRLSVRCLEENPRNMGG